MTALNLLIENPYITLALAGLLGLCVGSFLNVVIHRTPLIMHYENRKYSAEYWNTETTLADEHKHALLEYSKNDIPITLSYPASRCPNCGHKIRAYENIPVISWLVLLRGKCSGCSNPISIRYPMVELITALLSVLVIYTLGVNIAGALGLIYLWILIALTGIDFDTQLLPDKFVYPLGMIGLAANTQNVFTSLSSAVWGGLLGFLTFWSVAKIYAIMMKKEGMGAGDFKLLGAIGAWLGVTMLPLIILLSAVLGSVAGIVLMRVRGESRAFAFGPYIAIAGVIALLWGQDIMAWYLGIYR